MNTSELLGNAVLSANGEQIGYVLCVYVSKKSDKITCFACADGEENEFFLAPENVRLEKNGVRGGARVKKPRGVKLPLGKPAFTNKGEFLGVISELTLGENGGVYTLDGGLQIAADRTVCADAVIVNNRRKPSAPAQKPKPPERENFPAAKIPSSNGNGYLSDLLGKRTRRDLFSVDGNLLAPKGTLITPPLIRGAARQNRLLELFACALTT